MKHRALLLISILLYKTMSANNPIIAEPRLWDNASDNLYQSNTILSKVCDIDMNSQSSLDGTFTILESIQNKSYTILASTSLLDSLLQESSEKLITIESKMVSIAMENNSIEQQLDSIRVNDFGGTWTALEAIKDKTTRTLFASLSIMDSINSVLDDLIVNNQLQAIDTFTIIQFSTNTAIEIGIILESISEQLLTNESIFDGCIESAYDILSTIESKLDKIENDIDNGFAGTFTVIESNIIVADTVQSLLDITYNYIINDIPASHTLLFDIEKKLCTVVSKVSLLDTEVITIESIADAIVDTFFDSTSKIDRIDSKIDTIQKKLISIDSKVDQITHQNISISSGVNVISIGIDTITAKICTVDSKVDLLNGPETTFNSTVDVLNNQSPTLVSGIDSIAIGAFGSLSDVLDSRVDGLVDLASTINSTIDTLDTTRLTLLSAIDYLNQAFVLDLSKICTIASKVDNINSTFDVLNSSFDSINMSVMTQSSVLDSLVIDIAIDVNVANTVNSKVDRANNESFTLLSKVCAIDSRLDRLDSKVDRLNTSLNSSKNRSIQLLTDMQQTWTILNAIDRTISSVIASELTISSKLSSLQVLVDLSGVYTAIAAISRKASTVFSSAVSLDSRIDVYNANCIMNLGPTFTAIAATTRNVCTAESYLDLFIDDVNTVLNYDGYGISIPVNIIDIDDTYTISSGGRYALQNNVAFRPGATNCILIDADNVHLNLCNLIVNQANVKAGTVAIKVASNRNNVSIENGVISNFTGGGIEFVGNNKYIRINNIEFINNGSNQLVINSSNTNNGASNIVLKSLMIDGAGGDCIKCNKASGIFIFDCITSGATSPGGGINLQGCNYIDIRNCTMNVNNAFGIAGSGVSNSFGMIDFSIDGCVANNNTTDGFRFAGLNKNGVLSNCTAEENGTGIRLTSVTGQLYDTVQNCIINNVSSRNTVYGIHIDDRTSNNAFLFNEMFSNATMNYQEDATEGPNTVLGNYAWRSTAGVNYTTALTTVNRSSLRDTTAFPSPEPTYWTNADVRT